MPPMRDAGTDPARPRADDPAPDRRGDRVTTPHGRPGWFVGLGRNPRADLRLLCFPYAGGAASVFRGWSERLPKTVEVVAVELPGHGARLREPPFTRLSSLIEPLVERVAELLDRPVALFGHSLGAIVAFELARALRRIHAPSPAHLFVSAARGPHVPHPDPPIHDAPEAALREKLRGLKGTPRAVLEHEELMRLMLPVLRADFALFETYAHAPEPPLDCAISVYGGTEDPHVDREALAAWRDHTRGACVLRLVHGDHFFLHEPTSLARLLQHLASELTAIGRARPARPVA